MDKIEKHYSVADNLQEELVMCCSCLGDGKDTCHNPDHGFIDLLSFHDIGRLGCPVCGHDERNKVKDGGDCELCNGTGKTTAAIGRNFCSDMGYDYENIQDTYGNQPIRANS